MGLVQIFDPSNNRTGRVHSSKLGAALEKGYQLHNAGEIVKIYDPKTGRTGTIPTVNLADALNQHKYRLADPGITDYAKAAVAGVGHGLGKVADTAVAGGNLINTGIGKAGAYIADQIGATDTADELRSFANESADYARDYWKNDKIAQDLTFDTGLEHNKGIRMSKNAGEFVGTLPLNAGVAGVVGKGAVAAGKALQMQKLQKAGQFVQIPLNASTATRFAGAGAGAEALRNNDPNASTGEKILRELGGIVLGDIAASGAMGAPKAIFEGSKRGAKAIGNLLSPERWYEFAIKKGDTTLDKEAIEATKAIGGKLDAKTIYKDNNVVNFIEKNFPEKAYQVAAKNTNDKVIASIEKHLDETLGAMPKGENSESTIRSLTSDADNMIEKLYNERKAKNEALYQNAFDIIGMYHELPSTSNSIKAAMEVFKKTHAPSTSGTTETGQGITSSAMDGIIKKWGNSENKSLILMDGNREINIPILRGKQVPYEEMVAQLRSLKEQRRKAGGGYREYFKSVEAAIEKDINNANPEFFKRYKLASKDYAENIAPFIQLDAARALISGEKPNFIWEHMNTPTNREEVRKALSIGGESGRKLFDIIKRTKAHAVITEKISKEGTFNQDKFIELFTKLKPEDEIVDLIGKNTYAKIKSNSVVLARKMKDVEKRLSNNSQTSTETLLNKYGATAGAVTAGGGIGYSVGGPIGAVVGALGAAFTKDKLAKAFARASQDPVLMNHLIKAAETNNDKLFISTLSKALENIKSIPAKTSESIKTNPALKSAIVIDGSTMNYYNDHLEENKKRPKGQALKEILNNPSVVKGAEFLSGKQLSE